jgi:GAF domain-containing protein/HAMP domain-containing protein
VEPATRNSLGIQRRLNFLNALVRFVPIMAIISAIGYVVIFFLFYTWQMLVAAVLALVGAMLFLLARNLLSKGKLQVTAFLLLLIGVMLFPVYALVWSGITIELILGAWAVTIFIAWYGFERNFQLIFAPIIGFCATVCIIAIDKNTALIRLNVIDNNLLRWLFPLVMTLGGTLLALVIFVGISTKRLVNRILPSILLIVLIPIIILSGSSILGTIESDRQTATVSLQNTVLNKNNSINTITAQLQDDLYAVRQDAYNQLEMYRVLARSDYPEVLIDRLTLRLYFIQLLKRYNQFQELMVINNNGLVVADSGDKFVNSDYKAQDFFKQGSQGLYVSPLFYFQPVDKETIIVSTPFIGGNGATVGVIACTTNISNIDQIINSYVGADVNAKYYLVDENRNILNGVLQGKPTQIMQSAIVTQAINNQTNGGLLYNHDSMPVFGVYTWLKDLRVALIAEIPQSIVFSNLRTTVITYIIIALISILIATLGIFYVVRSINAPLTNLEHAARQVATGNLNIRAQVEMEDEIGTVAHAFNEMTDQLKAMVVNLEDRVNERTRTLENRSRELQTAAQIARDASLAQNPDDLLNHAARLIRERFGFYHVGIFVIDDKNEYAVLRAAGGEAGQLMLANKHKLKVGEVGIVGHVAQSGEPRITLNVGADAVHFRNPLLPYTRSEMALPLKVISRVIGVLDVQSDKINAFDQDDITIMQILTDQLSVSIERTRLLQELEIHAAIMERSLQETTTRGWRSLFQQRQKNQGYRFDGVSIEPVVNPPRETLEALNSGTSVIIKGEHGKTGNILAVPIRLRGQALGILNLRFQSADISPDVIKLVEEAAGRLALALENARLVQDAQRLARRERQINVISAQVQQSASLETVLQNTIRELGNTLDVPTAFIQIGLNLHEEVDKTNNKG